jgi:cytochrome P450
MTHRPTAPGSAPEAIPSGPPGYFGLRNLLGFVRDQLTFLPGLAQTYGDVVSLRMFGRPWFLVSHPDDIETVLVKHQRIMVRDDYSEILRRALGMGLLTNDGEPWKRQRKLIAQAFTPNRIRDYAATMVDVTTRAIAPWRGDAEINLHQEMSRVTMAVVAEVLFGAGMSPGDVATVREAMVVVNEFFANSPEAVMRLPAWVPTPRNRRMNRAVRQLDGLLYRVIAARRDATEPRDDLLGTLLAAQDDAGGGMTDTQLRDEAITLFLAGHETTALALAHTFYLLGRHPEVEARMHDELARVLAGRAPTAADVKALAYTECVLKESMRLYPPAWITGREAAEGFELRGHAIPAGAQILMSQWVVHRDARWFPAPERFDPDRWQPERARLLPKFAYFPFGGGPRVCVGNHFAMMEAALILATVAQRFRVELVPGERLELAPSVTLRQKGSGLRARLVARPPAETLRPQTAVA